MTTPICEACALEDEWDSAAADGAGNWVPRQTLATHAAPVVRRVWEDSYPSDEASGVTFLCEEHIDKVPTDDNRKPVVSRLDQSDKAPRVIAALERGIPATVEHQ